MSLVNDMLRDLDQRRRDTEGPASRVKLTPASDGPAKSKKTLIILVAFGLALVAGALVYIWLQISGGETTRQLDLSVAPRQVSTAVAAVAVESADSPAVANAASSEPAPPAVAIAEPTTAQALDVAPAPGYIDAGLEAETDSPAAGSPAQDGGAAIASGPPAVTPQPERAAETIAETPPAPLAGGVPLAPELLAAPEPGSTATRLLPDPFTVDLFKPQPVKAVTETSPEERDTLAVQEALRLIANNQASAAFAALDRALRDNPGAHQTRETYAKLMLNQGDHLFASELIEAGLALAPNHSGFKKVKARLLIGAGDIGAAVDLLVSRAPQVSSDLEYHEILASAQLASRDYRGAVLSYTSLVQQDQSQGRWWYGFAAAQDALGNATAARQAYNRAVEKPNLSASLRRRSQERLSRLGR